VLRRQFSETTEKCRLLKYSSPLPDIHRTIAHHRAKISARKRATFTRSTMWINLRNKVNLVRMRADLSLRTQQERPPQQAE